MISSSVLKTNRKPTIYTPASASPPSKRTTMVQQGYKTPDFPLFKSTAYLH
jgi:hypothetical protein